MYDDTPLHFFSTIPPQVPPSHSVGVVRNFVKRSTIPRGKSGINSRANIFGASYESDALQDNRLEKYHPIGIPFPRLYAFELLCKGCDELFTVTARWYIIELGWQSETFFTYIATYHPC